MEFVKYLFCYVAIASSAIAQVPADLSELGYADAARAFVWTGDPDAKIRMMHRSLKDLEAFSSAETVVLVDRRLSDEEFKSIEGHQHVKYLIVKSDELTSKSLESLRNCDTVRYLHLDCPKIKADDLPQMPWLPNLTKMVIAIDQADYLAKRLPTKFWKDRTATETTILRRGTP